MSLLQQTAYIPGNSNIIWDVFPEEFTESGHFQKFITALKKENFAQLIYNEKKRVQIFLNEWEIQLKNCSGDFSKNIDLDQLFLSTPKLSGILYFSHNTVLSEAFFLSSPEKIGHPTDRIIHATSKNLLPSSKDLTFSFPRKYFFEGFVNSWGFVRVERKNDQGYGAGIALSVTTLDPEVMDLMRKLNFQHLAHLYNQAWNGAIHDYIHHIALYTNPSFAIGKLSPMSHLNLEKEIDQWGEDMKDTFNYEYWAHCTHRLITQPIIEKFTKNIINDADQYFDAVSQFQKELLRRNPENNDLVERIGIYLSCIYLWPLHILLHPSSSEIEQIGNFVNRIHLKIDQKRIDDVLKSLEGIGTLDPHDETLSPLQKGIRATAEDLNLLKHGADCALNKYQYIRLKTDLVVQRGMYEGWYHKAPVQFQNKMTHPMEVMHFFLKKLTSTFDRFQNHPKKDSPYELFGIIPNLADIDLKSPGNFDLLDDASINYLLTTLGNSWEVKESKKIEKKYHFESFKQNMIFINRIATLCENENHHADMLIEFKSLKIIIWTHNVGGLTKADFILGAKIDHLFIS